MAKTKLSGCGSLGALVLGVMILGPIISFLAQVGWLIALAVLIFAGVAVYARIARTREAVQTLSKFVEEVDPRAAFMVFDTETSGLYPEEGARVVQIALIALDKDLNELGRYSTVINPHGSVGKSELHGVTKFRTFFAPDFARVAYSLHTAFNGKVAVAHNAEFDEKFLRMEFERSGMAMPGVRFLDTLALARKHIKGALNYKLMTLVSDLSVDLEKSPLGGAHDALYDAWCCGEILKEICRRGGIDPVSFIRRS